MWLRYASYTMLMVTCHSECCVPSELDFKPAGGFIVCCLMTSSRCKHYMAFSWLNVETLERAYAPSLADL